MAKKKRPRRAAGKGREKTKAAPAARGARRLRLGLGAAAALIILSLLLLYPELVFQRKIFVARDAEAAASFAKAAHRVMGSEHIYPFWNPYLFSGMPSYESMAYNPNVYPLSFITGFLITKLHFPPYTWLLFHYFLLGLGVVLLLRGRGVRVSYGIWAAVVMLWMPNLVAVGANGHGSQASAVAYMPYALWFWDRIWRGKGVLVNGAALALTLGFQLLRAHVQIAYYTYALLFLHFIFFAGWELVAAGRGRSAESGEEDGGRKGRSELAQAAIKLVRPAGALALVMTLALLMSSVLFVPVHEYAKYSIRGAGAGGGLDYDYATSWSLHPLESLTFIIPSAFGFGKTTYFGKMPFTDYPNYLGLVVFLAGVAAVIMVRERFVIFLGLLALVSTLVAFGKYLPAVYDPLFKFLPYFNKFRVPVMILIVQQLSFALLLPYGVQAMLRLSSPRARRNVTLGFVLFGIVFIVSLFSASYWEGSFARAIAPRIRAASSPSDQLSLARYAGSLLYKDLIKFSLLGGLFFACFSLYYRRVLARGVVVGLLALGSLVDLYLVDRYVTHPEALFHDERIRLIQREDAYTAYLRPDEVVSFLQKDDSLFRVFPMYHPRAPFYGDFTSNRFMVFGIASIGGYHAAKLALYNRFLQVLAQALQQGDYRLLDLINVRYLVTAYKLPPSERFEFLVKCRNWEGQVRYIYLNRTALPRAFLVDRYRKAQGERALTLLLDSGVDLSHEVILEDDPPLPPVSASGGRVEVIKYGFNEIKLRVKTGAPSILVMSEVYYPRWRAWVDGEEEEILRADYAFRALPLPAGSHKVVFRYDAGLIKKCFRVSLVSFLFALAMIIVGLYRQKGAMWKSSL